MYLLLDTSAPMNLQNLYLGSPADEEQVIKHKEINSGTIPEINFQ